MENKLESSEYLSPEKKELLELEKEGLSVFHGTGADVDMLEPRQAVDTKRGPDGDPGVFASDKADFAIFMAIINIKNCPRGAYSRAGARSADEGSHVLDFGVSKETMEQLQDTASGWVYVFNKSDFAVHPADRKEGVEFIAHHKVAPVRKILVSIKDLPEGIEVFDNVTNAD